MSDTADKYEFLRTIENNRRLRTIYSFVTHPSRMDHIPLDVWNNVRQEYETYYDKSVIEQSGGGGNVFKGHSTPRFSTDVHDKILRTLSKVLTTHDINHGHSVNFSDKETHGDVDIFVLSTDADKLRRLLGEGGEFSIYLQDHTPKKTIHMLYVLSDQNGTDTKYQIDFAITPNLEFSVSFCAFGYLGYFVGKVMSRFGFELHREGVYVSHVGSNSTPHQFLICDNFDEILTYFFRIDSKSIFGVGPFGVAQNRADQTLPGLVDALTKSDIFIKYPHTFATDVTKVGEKVIEFASAFNDAVIMKLCKGNPFIFVDPSDVAEQFISCCGKTESLVRWRATIDDDVQQRKLFSRLLNGKIIQSMLGLKGPELGQKIQELQTIEKLKNFRHDLVEKVSKELEQHRIGPDSTYRVHFPRDEDQIVVERSIIQLAKLGLLTEYINS